MNITGTSGGLEDDDWNVNANASTVLVFSLAGQTVPAGSMALLTNLTFDVLDFEGCLDFGQGAISDTWKFITSCYRCLCNVWFCIGGCTDDTACNLMMLQTLMMVHVNILKKILTVMVIV